MTLLFHQRCRIHAEREAAVCCPECGRFYCRECVTEHLGRMMCARCVAQSPLDASDTGSSALTWAAMAVVGLLLAWLIFYYLGIGLVRIPSTFHGTS